MSLRRIVIAFAVCAASAANAAATGPLSCYNWNPTFAEARDTPDTFIVVGHVENARKTDKDGTTDFVIEKVLQNHPALAGKKVVTMDRYVEIPDPKKPPRFVAIGDASNGKLDIYRGFVEEPGLVKYIEGLLKIETKDRPKLLRYAFDHLEDKNTAVADDAFLMFGGVTEADLRKFGEALGPEPLRKRLGGKDLSSGRMALYGQLLGYCGKPEDAKFLRQLLDDPDRQLNDGVLIGYTLLDPKAGHERLMKCITGPNQEFLVRLAALRALRFFWEDRPGVLTRKQILDGMRALMTDIEIADLSVDELRKWKLWDLTDDILALPEKDKLNTPILRRSVLKYALQCPGERAAKFVASQRKIDPERVKLCEEWLRDEPKPVAPPPRPRE